MLDYYEREKDGCEEAEKTRERRLILLQVTALKSHAALGAFTTQIP